MLRRLIIGLGIAVISVGLLGPGVVNAGKDCRRIMKYLSTGRTVEDIAETMMIEESQIEECQQEAEEQKAAEAAGGKGGEKEAAPSH